MRQQHQEFESRVNRLHRKRGKAMRSSEGTFIDQDGYVIVKAKSRARPMPFLGLGLLALGFFALKGLMIAEMGSQIYAIRIQELFNSPSLLTKFGAWTMQGDAVSLLLADSLQKLI